MVSLRLECSSVQSQASWQHRTPRLQLSTVSTTSPTPSPLSPPNHNACLNTRYIQYVMSLGSGPNPSKIPDWQLTAWNECRASVKPALGAGSPPWCKWVYCGCCQITSYFLPRTLAITGPGQNSQKIGGEELEHNNHQHGTLDTWHSVSVSAGLGPSASLALALVRQAVLLSDESLLTHSFWGLRWKVMRNKYTWPPS